MVFCETLQKSSRGKQPYFMIASDAARYVYPESLGVPLFEFIDVGRLAATTLAVPFSVAATTATSASERVEYSFAAAVVRQRAVELIGNRRETVADQLRSSRSRRGRETAAALAAKAQRIVRIRDREEIDAATAAAVSNNDAIRANFAPFSVKEISDACRDATITTQHGGAPFSRAEAVVVLAVAVARHIVGAESYDLIVARSRQTVTV
jgi:hypothetical protein